MTLQELVVVCIVISCIILLSLRIKRFIKRSSSGKGNPCSNCVSGCELRDQLQRKQQECNNQNKKE